MRGSCPSGWERDCPNVQAHEIRLRGSGIGESSSTLVWYQGGGSFSAKNKKGNEGSEGRTRFSQNNGFVQCGERGRHRRKTEKGAEKKQHRFAEQLKS